MVELGYCCDIIVCSSKTNNAFLLFVFDQATHIRKGDVSLYLQMDNMTAVSDTWLGNHVHILP